MKHRTVLLTVALAGLFAAGLMICTDEAVGHCGACGTGGAKGAAGKAISAGTGHSESTDAAAAGAEAAKHAKEALGGKPAKIVLVFDGIKGKPDVRQKILDAVAGEFDASIVYGCSAYAAITEAGNAATVGVVALAGAIEATAVTAPVAGKAPADYETCGKQIGEAIEPAVDKAGDKGKVLLLLGSCHIPRNNDVVKGICGVLGEKFPIAGAAAMGGLAYCKGKVLSGSNLGLLLTGDFTAGFGLQGAGDKPQPADVVDCAGKAFKQAVGPNKDRIMVAFAFDCGGRRNQMKDLLPNELKQMKDVIGPAPLIGFYGSGEVGPVCTGGAPKGVGYHIAAFIMLAK